MVENLVLFETIWP